VGEARKDPEGFLMSRLQRVLRFALAFAAIAAFSPASRAADAAGIVKPELLAELEACIKTQNPGFCAKIPTATSREALDACSAPFCSAVASLPAELTSEQARERLQEIARAIEKVANASKLLGGQARTLQGNAETGLAELRNGKTLKANEWDPDSLGHPAGDAARAALANCQGAECVAEASNLMALRVSSFAYRAYVQKINWPEVEKSAACTQLLRKRYESYFDATRFQWPWELYVNGQPWARGDTPLLCEGFRDVPTRQWIIMHPTLAIRYSDNASQNLGAAVVIELFGIRRWQWSEAEALNARGASLILSYSDQSDAKSVGWGAMVHLKDDVSLGLVRHSSDASNKISLVLGYEFGQLVGQDKAAACKKLFDASLCERVAK
jgi:hypothetical protein